ncbi:elongation factor 2 [Apiospora phragmitis]|uniref:Elongation factor 2 n=1 Tax=Apiospora phragmitis TaxID=2905665 RepID=A0ABR1VZC6_9PEZI
MPVVSPEKLGRLQSVPDDVRNVSPHATPEPKEYLINLIDSPGHIDFSSEVSTASRLCDGAVVLVDAVEGVCSQTVTVLRQTWIEKLKPLLVINKMDRLVTELKMSPTEAYQHLSKLLEQVNAVLGSFFQGERMEEDLNWRERMDERVAAAAAKEKEAAYQESESDELQFQERDDEEIYFAPEKNNVIFSSAIDGWAFTVRQFASLYEKKLGIKRNVMERVLWGDYYLDPKSKKVLGRKHLKGRNLKPMFVQLVLEQVWAIYTATTGGDNGRGSRDPKVLQSTIFSSWLPLSTALLVSVIESLPSPRVAQKERLPELLEDSPGASHIDANVRNAMINFQTAKSDPVVAYVSKMVSVPESELPANKRRGGQLGPEEARELARKKRAELARAQQAADTNGASDLTTAIEDVNLDDVSPQLDEKPVDPEHLIGFARMYSGNLSVGDELYVLPPKFSPAHAHAAPEPQKVTVTALYMMMGRNPRSGTLCSQLDGAVNLAGVSMLGQPIVRVALEPVNPADLDKMINGLKLLVQSDPCAEYEQFESGEHVLLTAGELHLERCLTDLKERFARCDVQAGAPIVPYRETIVRAEEMKPPANKELGRGAVVGVTSSKQVSITLRVRPLPDNVTEFLLKNSGAIKRLYNEKKAAAEGTEISESGDVQEDVDIDDDVRDGKALSHDELKQQLHAALETGKGREAWKGVIDKIAAFGPKRIGPNLLIDATKDGGCLSKVFGTNNTNNSLGADDSLNASHLSDKITYGFQLATNQGPLCNEPVRGIAVVIEDIQIEPPEDEASARDRLGRLTGEVIKTVQQSIRQGFLDWSPRLMLAMYSCEIQASTEVLGRVYDVLTRRRGRVNAEAMKEGTPFFTISSVLPVAESFGFADDMRKRTSGAAQPQLIFTGFEVLDEDPFWVPFTEEDLEDLGELGDKENVAKRYMDGVRRKKGLLVEGRGERRGAEKQKTLKR